MVLLTVVWGRSVRHVREVAGPGGFVSKTRMFGEGKWIESSEKPLKDENARDEGVRWAKLRGTGRCVFTLRAAE